MLEIASLDAFYGDSHILHGAKLAVGRGERVALLGRNGAGKSTLLKSVMNAGPRTRGRISFDGVDLAGADLIGVDIPMHDGGFDVPNAGTGFVAEFSA